jgi:UMF1 family MFS transporter
MNKERVSWYLYDFANSVFSTSVITVFLGPFFTSLAERSANSIGNIDFLFLSIAAGSFYPLIVSISVILQVIFLPILASIADNTKYKKHILFISAYIGAFATMAMFFVDERNFLLLGTILFIIANINFGASCTIYNSYLSHLFANHSNKKSLALPQNLISNAISSIGWATGYIGGGILLIINLLLYNNAEFFGISSDFAVRICLASAGIWWAIFTIFPLKFLSNINPINSYITAKNIFTNSITSLFNTIKNAKLFPQTLLFLFAYMIYNDGVQSVIVLASQFGSAELNLSMDTLIISILIVQLVAFFGSLICGKIANALSPIITLISLLIIWIFVILFAYFFLYTANDFYFICAIVGLIMGGSQSISRSIYSDIIPIGYEAEYFSLYEISEKGTSWIGPLIFAIVYNFTQSYRLAIISLVIFFVVGLILLVKFSIKQRKNI